MTKELAIIDIKENSIQVKDAAWNSLAEESKKAYASDYKLFFNFIKKDPKKITASDILKFIEHLELNNYKNSSINRKIASISKMFKVMVIAREINSNPVDILKQFKNISYKISKSVNIGLSLKDVEKAVKTFKKKTIQEIKMSLIISMLVKNGLRISELIGIKNNDILDFDTENKIISLIGKGKKERKIFLDNKFIDEIRKIYPLDGTSPYLFYTIRNNHYDRKVLWKQIKLFFKKRINKNVHPHLLRHVYITQKISVEKMDIKAVSKYVGHQNISTTLDMYVDTALDVKDAKIKI